MVAYIGGLCDMSNKVERAPVLDQLVLDIGVVVLEPSALVGLNPKTRSEQKVEGDGEHIRKMAHVSLLE